MQGGYAQFVSQSSQNDASECSIDNVLNKKNLDEYCLAHLDTKYRAEIEMKYNQLLKKGSLKIPFVHKLPKSYFIKMHKNWKEYVEKICYDPTVNTDLKSYADSFIDVCVVEQQYYYLKSLENYFEE